jgi:L-lactate dehydrogenase
MVLPISTQLNGEYGIKHTCTSLPTLVNRAGVVKRYEMELWPRELAGLQSGSKNLDATYAQVQK